MSRFLSLANARVISTASSSNAHGTRYEVLPWSRECDDNNPKASQRLNTAASGFPSKPPMSWLQKPNPHDASDSPPRSDSAIDTNDDVLSPPQCSGIACPPAVADRANNTA